MRRWIKAALVVGLGSTSITAGAATHTLPLVPPASNEARQGFVRILNHSDRAGTVSIHAIDDAGRRFGPVSIFIAAKSGRHFDSRDLERGNVGKGLSGGVGNGTGSWRLELDTELDIEPLAYIRTSDGFLTSIYQRVLESARRHHVTFFNPGGNRAQVSKLRLINPAEDVVSVTIAGRDDAGEPAPGGEVRLTLAPGASRMLTVQELEFGGPDLGGSLGDGKDKWQLFLSADAPIELMNLLQSPTGHLTNLSAPGLRGIDATGSRAEREVVLPLFLPASNQALEVFTRIINYSDSPGTVRIYGIDDNGEWYGPAALSLAAGAVAHFNSRDLEEGNPAKGLTDGVGSGVGSWRVRMYTNLDIAALAYIRTADGFVTAMHERVRESAMRHHVPIFNPASNRNQVSKLRLINPTEGFVSVTIAGRDDAGEPAPRGEVRLSLAPGMARTLTAQELETGAANLDGSLGDGEGKWQLFLSASAPVEAMSLLESPTGHLTNLSASGVAGVVSVDGIDQPVALDIVVEIPPEVTTVKASDLTTTVLGSPGGGVPPRDAPSLMVASDADGAVMYALGNEDGGFLGESAGTIRVSIGSTAVVLVALAAGHRIPSVTPQIVDGILSHADYGKLTRLLVRLMGSDKDYLVRLSDYPDVVALIRSMAGSRDGGEAARSTLVEARQFAEAARRDALPNGMRLTLAEAARRDALALPNGIVKGDFYCLSRPLPFFRKLLCSPWDEHEPWRWFGDARGAEAYYPDGTSWTDFFLAIGPVGVFLEAYYDFLEEAAQPPFLARSELRGVSALHAAANPSFVGYAMELYAGPHFQGWYYVPGNSTTFQKLRNSGAALREVLAGDNLTLGPHIDRIRFRRYPLTTLDRFSDLEADHATFVNLHNTAALMISISSIVVDLSALQDFLIDSALDPNMQAATVTCAHSIFDSRSTPVNDPNASPQQAAVDYYRAAAPSFLKDLTTMDACRALFWRGGKKVVSVAADLAKSVVLDVVALITTGGVKAAFSAANDMVPSTLSYFAPKAAGSEYFVEWERTRGGQPYIARVSQSPLPVAEFTYAQERGHQVLLDASQSDGEGLRYDWKVAKRSIGTGRTLEYDFGRTGRFEMTLTVTDRNGRTAVEHGSVMVTEGRVPEVRELVCMPFGNGTAFTMQADLADEDGDIARVEWRSAVSDPRPDEVTVAGRDVVAIVGRNSVVLNAPSSATHTWAQVRVVDAGGNEAAKNCEVVFGTESPLPRIADSGAKEGESIDFTVTLDRAPTDTVTYYYATYRNTAGGNDYTGHRDRVLTFRPGEASKTITVDTKRDARVEGTETFYVYITDDVRKLSDRGWPVDFLARAAGTILDDDEGSGTGTFRDCADCPEMVRVSGGCFQMGSPDSAPNRGTNERLHRVCLARFSIGKFEVTFDEYDRFADATGRGRPRDGLGGGWGRGRRPVIFVSWKDATAYAQWLSKETGESYRLPTEAEWEYAARAGSVTAYPWGDAVGRGRANCRGCGDHWDYTAPVGSFPPNAWGLHDTSGNVLEWTCSEYDEGYGGDETRCATANARRPVLRGGDWLHSPAGLRSAYRAPTNPNSAYSGFGLRVVRD